MIRKLRTQLSSLYGGVPFNLVLRLFAAPFILSLLDLTVTLFYQPAAYWNGDRSVVVEGNPIARYAFSIHPLMIIPGFVGWYGLVIPMILGSKAWIGLRIQVFLVSGHLLMISGWFLRNDDRGVIWAAILWILAIPLAWDFFKPFRRWWNAEQSIRSLSQANQP